MLLSQVLVCSVILALLVVIGVLIYRISTGKDEGRDLPLLTEVGRRDGASLTCPVCSSASFHVPTNGNIVGLSLGLLHFANLTERGTRVVECAACETRFRRGAPAVKPLGVRL